MKMMFGKLSIAQEKAWLVPWSETECPILEEEMTP